ncbi:putative flavin-binding monooxygenase [Aspergillus karnatakaensis]|uniref:flavin-containing monooxygenase n=1 Tax=Aspergillus karnatakaensis TaxID=1810916 RepID=UPI003CCD4D40
MSSPTSTPRPPRIIIIGAGISGLTACIRIQERIPGAEIQIYEKNADIGGTWFENRYPGCACDIPAHVYQATFAPNYEWSGFYASAQEIHAYWARVAERYGCRKCIRLRTEVVEARWEGGKETGRWVILVRYLQTGEVVVDEGDILLSCTGPLNAWQWPSIPGLHGFEGKLLHSASWDEGFSWENKSVAIIGNGSSGIQLVPAMLEKSTRIDHYVRGKTWISPPLGTAAIEEMGLNEKNKFFFTPEQISRFKADPEGYLRFRKDLESSILAIHPVTIQNTPEQKAATAEFISHMRARLAAKPELADWMIPSFAPACRRLTPGPGYLEALVDPKVNVITTGIEKVTANAIVTTDGVSHPVDVIVCATGFNTSFQPRFPIFGQNGVLLQEKWKLTPDSYLSIITDQFPNHFMTLGPNGTLVGSLLLLIEKQVEYITACIAKMQQDSIQIIVPRQVSVQSFAKFAEEYFKSTVFATKCRSWYKGGSEDGKVVALWPGSALHAIQSLERPRWEDFEIQYLGGRGMSWLGDGWTEGERKGIFEPSYLD